MRRLPRQCVLVTTCNGSLNREWGSGNDGLLTISSLWHLQVKFLCPCLLRILIFPIFFPDLSRIYFRNGLVWFGKSLAVISGMENSLRHVYISLKILCQVSLASHFLCIFFFALRLPSHWVMFFKYFIRDFPFKTMTWMFVYDFTCKWLLCRADSIS